MKYRKKPVVIEAFQMTGERRWDNSEWPSWLNEAWNKNSTQEGALFIDQFDNIDGSKLCIRTLEGIHNVGWGDYIIQGICGEIYPCKPGIFVETYELVGE
jgi:hypothetical protein